MSDDITFYESGDDGAVKYDQSTGNVQDGKEERPARWDEDVKASVHEQRLKKDAEYAFKQQAEKNLGKGGFIKVLERIKQVDDAPTHRERLSSLNKMYGVDDQTAGSELYHGASAPQSDPLANAPPEIAEPIKRFDAKFNDPVSKELRPIAAQIMARMPDEVYYRLGADNAILQAFSEAYQMMAPSRQAEWAAQATQSQRDVNREATERVKRTLLAREAGKATI